MRHIFLTSVALGTLALPVIATRAQSNATAGPEATYWLSAETASGMATNTPSGQARKLQLQLGTSRKAPGQPTAEHLPPSVLQAGTSLPLLTPAARPREAGPAGTPGFDPSKLKGRMLIYWGCGEQARPGQPLTVDFATMASGKPSPFASMLKVASMTPPSPGRHATYGEWPNSRGQTTVPAGGSLVGEHVVRGNYTPEIRFALGEANDFLKPLAAQSGPLPSGAMRVSWPALAHAKAYAASVIGSAGDGTVVMWSSSEVKMAGAALPDYLAQGEIARLVQQKALLGPQATECAVPAEVVKATRGAMLQMTAYGPEANFSAPRGAPAGWAVKVRSKATHMGMLDATMPRLGGQSAAIGSAGETPAQPKANAKQKLLKGLGSVLGQGF